MSWPSLTDYRDAIQVPNTCFDDPDLRAGTVTLTPRGLPRVASGNFASVYQIRNRDRQWAVRCFSRQPVADQHARYTSLSHHLTSVMIPYIVGFEYLPRGIRIRGRFYPIVKMEWVEGLTLNTFIQRNITNRRTLLNLAKRWRGLVNSLVGNRLAHGDLQHGNVMVTAEQELCLVDYDGMYVPRLKDKTSPELGHPNYQHPRRQTEHYEDRLDGFSALCVFLSIRALVTHGDLWGKYSTGENLIFTKADFETPARSELFNRLRSSPDAAVRSLTDTFMRACLLPDPLAIPALEDVLDPMDIDDMFPSVEGGVQASRPPASAGYPTTPRPSRPIVSRGPTTSTPVSSPTRPMTAPPPRRPILRPPRPLTLGDVRLGQMIGVRLGLSNDGNAQLVVTLTSSVPGLLLGSSQVTVGAGRDVTIVGKLDLKNVPLGRHSGQISIQSNAGVCTVPVSFNVNPPKPGELALSIDRIELGQLDPYKSRQFVLEVINQGEEPLEAEMVYVPGSCLKADRGRLILKPGERDLLYISVDMRGAGRTGQQVREILSFRAVRGTVPQSLEVSWKVWRTPSAVERYATAAGTIAPFILLPGMLSLYLWCRSSRFPMNEITRYAFLGLVIIGAFTGQEVYRRLWTGKQLTLVFLGRCLSLAILTGVFLGGDKLIGLHHDRISTWIKTFYSAGISQQALHIATGVIVGAVLGYCMACLLTLRRFISLCYGVIVAALWNLGWFLGLRYKDLPPGDDILFDVLFYVLLAALAPFFAARGFRHEQVSIRRSRALLLSLAGMMVSAGLLAGSYFIMDQKDRQRIQNAITPIVNNTSNSAMVVWGKLCEIVKPPQPPSLPSTNPESTGKAQPSQQEQGESVSNSPKEQSGQESDFKNNHLNKQAPESKALPENTEPSSPTESLTTPGSSTAMTQEEQLPPESQSNLSNPEPDRQNISRKVINLSSNVKMVFVWIPAGSFYMGSDDRDDEKPVRAVEIRTPFYIGQYEVTWQQWDTVMQQKSGKSLICPVDQVSWDQCQEFCIKATGLAGGKVRLPTEAEWEYACRAGNQGKFCFGDKAEDLERYAWYNLSTATEPRPVGGKDPNKWGLYDMHGNVREWCADWYEKYPQTGNPDRTNPWIIKNRACRGGSINSKIDDVRSASRFQQPQRIPKRGLGLRVVLEVNSGEWK